MNSVHNFFKAPTNEQKDEIDWLCKRGMSTNCFTCRIRAPIQGMTALVFAAIDVPAAPIKGLGKACYCLIQGSFAEAGQEFIAGLDIGVRSIFQVAILIGTIVGGLFDPNRVYGALQELNLKETDPRAKTLKDNQSSTQEDTSDVSKLQKKIDKLTKINEKYIGAVKNFKEGLGIENNALSLKDLLLQLQEERLEKVETSKLKNKVERENEKYRAAVKNFKEGLGIENNALSLKELLKSFQNEKIQMSQMIEEIKNLKNNRIELCELVPSNSLDQICLTNQSLGFEERLGSFNLQMEGQEKISNDLRKELDAKSTAIFELQQQFEKLKIEKSILSEEVLTLKSEIEEKVNAFVALEKNIGILELEKSQSDAKNLVSKKALQEKEGELEKLNQKFLSIEKNFKLETEQLSTLQYEYEQQAVLLQENSLKYAELTGKLNQKETELLELSNKNSVDIEKLQSSIEQKNAELDQSKINLESLEQQKEEVSEELKALNLRFQNAEKRLLVETENLSKLQNEFEGQTKLLEKNKLLFTDLEETCLKKENELQTKISELQAKLENQKIEKNQDNEVIKSEEELNAVEHILQSKEQKKQQTDLIKQNLLSGVKQRTENINARLSEEHQEMMQQLKEVMQQNEILSNDHKNVLAELEKIKLQYSELFEEHKKAKLKLQKTENLYTKLSTENQSLINLLKSKENKVEVLTNKNSELKKQKKELEVKLKMSDITNQTPQNSNTV